LPENNSVILLSILRASSSPFRKILDIAHTMAIEVTLNYTYAFLLVLGGIFGFVKSGSTASLVMSSVAGALMVFSAYRMSRPKGRLVGYRLAIVVSFFLMCFMGYRYYNGAKFMPAGAVATVSAIITFLNSIQLNKLN